MVVRLIFFFRPTIGVWTVLNWLLRFDSQKSSALFVLIRVSLSLSFALRSECTDSMKDSLAAALRHSREQAQSTYDRRTACEKKAAALRLAREKAEEGADPEVRLATEQSSKPEITVGQFVGLVTEESTLQNPSIMLARVQAFLPDGQVSLLWYRNVGGGGLYALEVDGSQWIESVDALVPVKAVIAKGRSHSYRLMTSVRTIHKAVHGVARHS